MLAPSSLIPVLACGAAAASPARQKGYRRPGRRGPVFTIVRVRLRTVTLRTQRRRRMSSARAEEQATRLGRARRRGSRLRGLGRRQGPRGACRRQQAGALGDHRRGRRRRPARQPAERAAACVRHLENKREFLHYDQALAVGWPIATGVIVSACRHLIADRLSQEYWQHHLEREHQRLYPALSRDNTHSAPDRLGHSKRATPTCDSRLCS